MSIMKLSGTVARQLVSTFTTTIWRISKKEAKDVVTGSINYEVFAAVVRVNP